MKQKKCIDLDSFFSTFLTFFIKKMPFRNIKDLFTQIFQPFPLLIYYSLHAYVFGSACLLGSARLIGSARLLDLKKDPTLLVY